MLIDVPDHRVRDIALAIANRRTMRNQAHAARDFRRMELAEQFLGGADLFLDYLGPRQRAAVEAVIKRAMPDPMDPA
jgi:hypothetical protein